jgi:predicted nucleic acid-binding protein
MVLYKQMLADKLLIDDQRGRAIAKMNSIETIGSLGVLLIAKQQGLIHEITPLLLKLNNSDIYLSKALINTVLALANESSD